MGIGGSLSAASALPHRPVADRGGFVWSVLIATMAALVLPGCSAGTNTLVQSDGRRAGANPCWTSGGSRQSAGPRRSSVCGTAGLQRTAALPERLAHRPVGAQPRRKLRVKPRLCHIRPTPTRPPASPTRLRASNPIAHPRAPGRARPPRRPPLRMPPTRYRTPNNR